jgi:hypothetical protein
MATFYPFSIFHMAEFRERSVRRMRSLTVVWPEDRGCRGEVGALAGYISISRGGMSHPTGHTILTGSVQNYIIDFLTFIEPFLHGTTKMYKMAIGHWQSSAQINQTYQ